MSTSLPKTYKAAAFESTTSNLKLVEKPLVLPNAGQVLVKVLACGVCHSDSLLKSGAFPLPRVPGHEVVGDVVAVGPDEKRWKVGDRVGGGWHGGHCYHCTQCTSGDFMTCQTENINGILTDGGYAEYVLLRSEAVVKIPESADPAEVAPLLCAGVTTFNSLRHMNLNPGDVVAIQGIGGLGHLAIQYARKMGFRVAALSSSPSKKSLATELGAHYYLDGSKVNQAEELQKLGGAKVIVCTAPSADVINDLLGGIAVGGTLLLLAVTEGIKISSLNLIGKRASIRGWPSGTAKDSEETIEFSELQDIHCRVEKYKLEDVEQAYDRMMSGKANFRAVLIP